MKLVKHGKCRYYDRMYIQWLVQQIAMDKMTFLEGLTEAIAMNMETEFRKQCKSVFDYEMYCF